MGKPTPIIDSTIHSRLEKEVNSFSRLEETLLRSGQAASEMTTILTSIEDRLAKLEKTILPVYNETENLQRRQENISKAFAALDHIIEHYNRANSVEHIIKDGPTCGLEVYLESIDKLQASIKFFDANNKDNPELSNLMMLFDTAGDALEKEFRLLLTRNSKPVAAIVILDLVSFDEELPEKSSEKETLQLLPEKALEELKKISSWLLSKGREDFMTVYSSYRASTLLRSLQGFKEYHKSASGSSASGIPAHGSPALSRARMKETPPTKTTKKIQQAIINKASKKIMNFSQTMEQAAGFGLGHRKQGSSVDLKDEMIDGEMEFYQSCVSAFHKLMQSEMKLMEEIIPSADTHKIFERIIHPGLDFVVQEGESIASKAKKCVSRHDFLGALDVFPIIKHLISLKPEIDKLLKNCQPLICNKFANVIETLQTMGLKALDNFIESIKTDIDRQMPKDGTVHELTSNVMMFLEQLMDYVDTAGALLAMLPAEKKINSPVGDNKKKALGQYTLRVLTMLNSTTTNKSDSYDDIYLKAVFRLNNLHYILKSLQRTGLLEIVQCYNRHIEEHFNDQIREQKRLYSHSWSRVLHYVMEVDKPLTPTSEVKLKDKDRQNIKDKFTGFNKEMEDIFKTQKGYAIPDVELRESIKRENKDYILPKYQAFYDKYNRIAFTKNPEKYIKYTPVDVSLKLDRFFDVAA